MIEHKSPISTVAYCRGQVVTGGYDNRVILWDPRHKSGLARADHDHLVNYCTFARDGASVLSASSDHSVRRWSANDLRLQAVYLGHEDDVEMVAPHPHRAVLATASRDHTARVFHESGKELFVLKGHSADVLSVAWVGDQLVTSGDDGVVYLWAPFTRGSPKKIDLGGAETDALVVSERGIIFAGNDEGEILVIDPMQGYSVSRHPAHTSGVKRLAYLGSSCKLLSVSYDQTMRLWDVAIPHQPKLVQVVRIPNIVWPRSCTFAGEDRALLGSYGTSYVLYDFRSRTWDVGNVHETGGVNALEVSNEEIVTVGDSGVVKHRGEPVLDVQACCTVLIECESRVLVSGQSGKIFDSQSGTLLYQYGGPINCAGKVSHAGVPLLVFGTYSGHMLVFSFEAGGLQLAQQYDIFSNAVKGIACSQSAIFLVSATGESAIFRFTEDGFCLEVLTGHSKIANGCVCVDSEKDIFMSVGRDKYLLEWHGNLLRKRHSTPHTHSIKCIAASKCGRYVATGSYNGTVALFDRLTSEWVKTTRPTTSGISALVAHQSGFSASSYDGKLHRMEAA